MDDRKLRGLCQYCFNPLDASPSDDFCGPKCQGLWHAARSDPDLTPDYTVIPHGAIPPGFSYFEQLAERLQAMVDVVPEEPEAA